MKKQRGGRKVGFHERNLSAVCPKDLPFSADQDTAGRFG